MSMLIEAISRTTDRNEVFAHLNVFLPKLAESSLVRHIPLDLRPLQISTGRELNLWLERLQCEVDRRQSAGQPGEETLRFLQDLLQTACMRVRLLSE